MEHKQLVILEVDQHKVVRVKRTISDDIVLHIERDGKVLECTTLSWGEVIYLIADLLSLWRCLGISLLHIFY